MTLKSDPGRATDGLDPNQKHEVRLLIQEMAADKAIVLSTHILEEVDAVCTRAVIISDGQIVADGTPEQLQSRAPGHNAVHLEIRGADAETVWATLAGVAGVDDIDVTQENNSVHCTIANSYGQRVAGESARPHTPRAGKLPSYVWKPADWIPFSAKSRKRGPERWKRLQSSSNVSWQPISPRRSRTYFWSFSFS